jgi:sugar-specific transcriptional regulator TrmB
MNVKRIFILDQNQKVLFKGNPLSLPYKKDSIVSKCIELFNDHDPCIIHESYAIHQLSEELIGILRRYNQLEIPVQNIILDVPFIDFSKYADGLLKIEVK